MGRKTARSKYPVSVVSSSLLWYERSIPTSPSHSPTNGVNGPSFCGPSASLMRPLSHKQIRQFPRGPSAHVSLTRDDPLGRREFGQTHRPAGVHLLRRDPDLRTEAELAAVGEPGGRVHHHR